MLTTNVLRIFRRCLAVAVWVAANAAPQVYASTTRVDDSGTVVNSGALPMKWKQLAPGRRGTDNAVEAEVNVAVRLDLRRWVNRPLQIYIVLAPTPGDPIFATWRTRGALLPGTLVSGRRTVIFNGLVKTALLEESMDLTVKTDGRTLVSPRALQFYFEVDTP